MRLSLNSKQHVTKQEQILEESLIRKLVGCPKDSSLANALWAFYAPIKILHKCSKFTRKCLRKSIFSTEYQFNRLGVLDS